jgi:putative ABC transport system permease protein
MNYTNTIKIATNALKRNKFRAGLTMLGIIIGVSSVIGMLSIGEGSKRSIRNQISGMGSNMIFVMPGSQQRGGAMMGNANAKTLTLEDVEKLQKESQFLSAVSPQVTSSGQAINGNKNLPTSMSGVNEKFLEIRKYELKDGRMFNQQEINSLAKVCIIGRTVADTLFGKKVDPVGQTIRFANIPFRIIGLLKEKGQNTMGQDQDNMIVAPYSTVQRRILAITHIQTIFASAVSEEKSASAITEIRTIMRKQHKLKEGVEDDFTVRSQAELIQTLSSVSDMLTMLLGAIAGISLLVGGIGIMNIMFVSVTERTREIGLRMAVGGRGRDILIQFLIEAVLLSVMGGVIGILLGLLISYVAANLLNFPLVIMSKAIFLSFVVCSAIGIFFGWYPAKKAANLNPIDAIRYE